MNRLELVGAESFPEIKFSKEEFNKNFVRAVRVFYLFAILVFVLAVQSSQSSFINIDVLIPLYSLLSFSFLLNSLYLIFFEKLESNESINVLFFAIDALVITGFNYYSQGNNSVFLVLYLINIILCGFRYRTQGAILLAFWSSALFSLLLVVGPQVTGQKLYLSIALNNFAYFAVAFLSGHLSSQFLQLNLEVEKKRSDLRSLQNLNEKIISNIANGLVSVDSYWRIVQYNAAAEKIFGKSLKEKTLKEVFFHKFEKVRMCLDNSAEEGTSRIELGLELKGNRKIILEIIASALRNDKGNVEGYILLMQDLTDIKNMEKELRQKDKLAAVGQLAAGIAHEIRNPLAGISGSVQLLASGDSQNELESKKLMGITIKEIDRLDGLITEFLEYVTPDHGGSEPINVNEILTEVFTSVELNDDLNKYEIVKNLASHQMILGDPNKLKQAFLNIVINALQSLKSEGKKIEVMTFDEKNTLKVVVKDEGEGIAEDQLDKIFQPFHTTKPKGTGLGLAITHRILEAHGVRVGIKSEVGVGTQFELVFPVSPNPVGTEAGIRKEA